MSKIMIVIAMMMLASLASPLFAIATNPPDGKIVNKLKSERVGCDGKMVVIGKVGVVASKREWIFHKDSLMYSLPFNGKIEKDVAYVLKLHENTSSAMVSKLRDVIEV